VEKKSVPEDELMELALDAGAQDVREEENEFEIITDPDSFDAIKKAIDQREIKYIEAKIGLIPQTTVKLEAEKAVQMLKMMEKLEDNDDVQNVYANFDIADEIMERLSA
jgi:transcriptional/translational regulatory protein YebC/TACO1